jgi:hypothetical protein
MTIRRGFLAFFPFIPLSLFILFPAHSGAERVRTIIPRATLAYLSVPVAEVRGFFRDENLDNETIVIPGATAIAALVSALPDGVPGVPTPQGLKNVIEFDVKAPLKIKEEVPADRFLHLKLAAEVKEELERKR